jgi:hypothetical protein
MIFYIKLFYEELIGGDSFVVVFRAGLMKSMECSFPPSTWEMIFYRLLGNTIYMNLETAFIEDTMTVPQVMVMPTACSKAGRGRADMS